MTNLMIVRKCSFQSSVYHSLRFQTTLSHASVKSKAQYDCTSQRTNWPLLFCLHVNMFQFLVFSILNPLLFQYVGFVCCCDLISFCFVFSVDDMTASVSGGRKCCSSVWWCVLSSATQCLRFAKHSTSGCLPVSYKEKPFEFHFQSRELEFVLRASKNLMLRFINSLLTF